MSDVTRCPQCNDPCSLTNWNMCKRCARRRNLPGFKRTRVRRPWINANPFSVLGDIQL